jgi:hypothetical protein
VRIKQLRCSLSQSFHDHLTALKFAKFIYCRWMSSKSVYSIWRMIVTGGNSIIRTTTSPITFCPSQTQHIMASYRKRTSALKIRQTAVPWHAPKLSYQVHCINIEIFRLETESSSSCASTRSTSFEREAPICKAGFSLSCLCVCLIYLYCQALRLHSVGGTWIKYGHEALRAWGSVVVKALRY